MQAIKSILKYLCAFVLVFLIFWSTILTLLQTEKGRKWFLKQFISYIEAKTDTQIQIERIHVQFPLQLSIDNLTIAQENQPLVEINHAEFTISFLYLLQGRIVFSTFYLSAIELFSLPSFTQTSTNNFSFETTLLPFYVKIQNLCIERLHIQKPVLQQLSLSEKIDQILQHTVFNLNGTITHNPFKKGIFTHLLFTANSQDNTIPIFTLGIDSKKDLLAFSGHFDSIPLSLFPLEILDRSEMHAAFYATAPINSWKDIFYKKSSSQEAIEGHFKISLKTDEVNTAFSAITQPMICLKSHYSFFSLGEIQLSNLSLRSPHIAIDGNTILTSEYEFRNGHLNGRIDSLASFQTLFSKKIEGSAQFDAKIEGNIFSPKVKILFKSPLLTVENHPLHDISTALTANFSENEKKGFFEVETQYKGIFYRLASRFNWDTEALTFSRIHMKAPDFHAEGEAIYVTEKKAWQGLLHAHFQHLQTISTFLSTPIEGKGDLTIRLFTNPTSKALSLQGMEIQLTGHSLHSAEWQAEALKAHLYADPEKEEYQFYTTIDINHGSWKEYAFDGLHLSAHHRGDLLQRKPSNFLVKWESENFYLQGGSISHAFGEIQIADLTEPFIRNFSFTAQQAHFSTLHVDELIGETHFRQETKSNLFSLKGRGHWQEAFIFESEGTWNYKKDEWQLALDQAKGTFESQEFHLQQPIQIVNQPQFTHLSPVRIQWKQSTIQMEFSREKEYFTSHIETTLIPIENFPFFNSQIPMTGTISVVGQFNGLLQQPLGKLIIRLHDVKIAEYSLAQRPFIDGNLEFSLGEKAVQISSSLQDSQGHPLQINGILPVTIQLAPLGVQIQKQVPTSLTLLIETEIAPYARLFYHDGTALAGHVKIDAKVTGDFDYPQVQGSIDFADGSYESINTGAIYHAIQGNIEINRSNLSLSHFSAQDSKNGSIEAQGKIQIDVKNHFPFEFYLKPSHLFIINSDYATISASGSLVIRGNTKQSKLQGTLVVDQGSIHLEETLPGQIKTVDVTYINQPTGDQSLNTDKKTNLIPLDLDIQLQIPQPLMIQAHRLNSEWMGEILITGSLEKPLFNGDLRITKGEYNFNGKVFQLTQGSIHFGGSPSKKTSLYVVASKDIDRIRTDIIVKGLVTQPKISFRSNPAMSQREVLSYILFNRGISDITSTQGDQLSQSFISLNSSDETPSSDDFLSRLRNNIGIDRLDFSSSGKEDKDFSLQVGKHITENISVTLNKSINATDNRIAVEVNLKKNLKAQAEVGTDAQVTMSLKWKKEY